MKRPAKTNRREFLKHSAAASAAAFAVPHIVPATALGKDGAVAANSRVALASIGTGGKGRHNLGVFLGFADVQVTAVCDVDRAHLNLARDMVNKKNGNQDCKSFGDFRELLELKGIDAVCVSTPDHWHALPSIAAAKAGLDVYCEKPLTNSVGEGIAVVKAVKGNKRILQTGSHERSTADCRKGCEAVRNGRIGKLHTIRIQMPSDQAHHNEVRKLKTVPPTQPVPDGFDYDFWLGHTPKVPYTPKRCHFWWRFILAHGGGEMTDRGAHIIDLAQLGAGKDDTGPVEFDATGSRSTTSLYDAFMDYQFTNTYADGLKMIGVNKGPRGVKFEGTDGWLFINVHGGRLEASDPAILKDGGKKKVDLGRSPGHHRNFIDCVKSRQEPYASVGIGHRTATICHLNNIAMIVGRKIKWDPVKEQIIDDSQASKLLTPKMRAPWKL